MFTVCVGFVFGSKYVQFRTICTLQCSIKVNTVEVNPDSNSLQNGIVKPKNTYAGRYCYYIIIFYINFDTVENTMTN